MIEARELVIGYGAKTIGRDIMLAVAPGEVLCLLGPNGSGKTTLFKTLLGLIPARGGTIRIAGDLLADLDRRSVAQRIAYVPQAHTAHFPFRVVDMVTMGRTAHLGLFAKPGSEDHARARDALALLGISALGDIEYTRISGGQRQLVLIARALAQDAPAIVMDEPTASLDFGNQVLVLRQVRRLADRGLAVVLSTHDPHHAISLGDRVAFLHEGRVVAQGRPADVLTADRLQAVYGVSVTIETLQTGQTVCVADFETATSTKPSS